MKCAAPTHAVHASGHTDLRIARLDPTDAARYGDVLIEAFDMPTDSALPAWCASQVSIPGFQMYGAWDGDVLAATAALYLSLIHI